MLYDRHMEDRHVKFMKAALEEALAAQSRDEVPIGAVLVLDGEIIARGSNTRESEQDATGHAEIAAIREACRVLGSWRLYGCDLYVTLEPCLMCAGAIIQARIGHVYFGAFDPKSGMAGSISDVFSLPSNHRTGVTGGILEEECGILLRNFFERKRGRMC